MLENYALAFLNGAGQGLGGGMGGGGPTALYSGAPADLRAGFSNAGWTVSTGSSRAEGATITGDPTQAAYSAPAPVFSAAPASAMQAGGGLLLPLMIGGALLAFILARKKKG